MRRTTPKRAGSPRQRVLSIWRSRSMLKPKLPHWLRAGEVFESLLAEAPESSDYQRNVALVQKYLGAHYQRTGDLDQALQHHLRALTLDRRRAAAAPTESSGATGSRSTRQRGVAPRRRRTRSGGKSPDTRRAATSAAGWPRAIPKDDYARGRLAFVLSVLARCTPRLSDTPRRSPMGREAVQIAEARTSGDSETRSELVDHLSRLAEVARAAGRLDLACPQALRAAALAAEMEIVVDKERTPRDCRPSPPASPPCANPPKGPIFRAHETVSIVSTPHVSTPRPFQTGVEIPMLPTRTPAALTRPLAVALLIAAALVSVPPHASMQDRNPDREHGRTNESR